MYYLYHHNKLYRTPQHFLKIRLKHGGGVDKRHAILPMSKTWGGGGIHKPNHPMIYATYNNLNNKF